MKKNILFICLIMFGNNFYSQIFDELAQCNQFGQKVREEVKKNNIEEANRYIKSLNDCLEGDISSIERVLPNAFAYINEFENGITTAKLLNGKFCFIDKNLTIVKILDYDFVGKILEDVIAVAKKGQKAYYIDTNENKLDIQHVIDVYQKAANNGSALAMNSLVSFYTTGNGVAKNSDTAFFWCKKAAEKGFPNSMNALGDFYFYGWSDENKKDLEKAFEWFKKAAEKGNVDAIESLANMYFYGTYVQKDYKSAAYWYEKAVFTNKSALSFSGLGVIYSNGGYGVEKNEYRAVDYFKAGYHLGDALSAYNLASFYNFGSGGLQKNSITGKELLEESSNLDKTGYFNKVYLYEGEMNSPDGTISQARTYLLKSANLGYSKSYNEICKNYELLEISPEDAKKWCQKACEAGYTEMCNK